MSSYAPDYNLENECDQILTDHQSQNAISKVECIDDGLLTASHAHKNYQSTVD